MYAMTSLFKDMISDTKFGNPGAHIWAVEKARREVRNEKERGSKWEWLATIATTIWTAIVIYQCGKPIITKQCKFEPKYLLYEYWTVGRLHLDR